MKLRSMYFSICAGLAVGALGSDVGAQTRKSVAPPTSDEIAKQLDEANAAKPKAFSRERGFSLMEEQPDQAAPCTKVFSDLRAKTERQRGFTLDAAEERKALGDCEQFRPQANLEVFFELGSADLTQEGMSMLNALGGALKKGQLQGKTFVIAGHTDARGTPEFNQALSQKRAETVRDVLIKVHQVDPRKLIVAGYGFEKLKNPGNPLADENRRVQVVNLGQ